MPTQFSPYQTDLKNAKFVFFGIKNANLATLECILQVKVFRFYTVMTVTFLCKSCHQIRLTGIYRHFDN